MRNSAATLAALLLVGCGALGGPPTLSDAQQAIADLKFKEAGVTVTGAVEPAESRFHVGDRVGLAVTVNRDASVAVFRVERSGVTTRVFPNRSQPDAHVKAGAVLHIPAAGSVLSDKPGPELFKFIAATGNADAWLFTRKPAPGAEYVDLGSTSRAIAHDIRNTLKGPAASAHLIVDVGG